jgi:DNA-binding winged helix-turn-helix (wHTH) protein
MDDSQAAAIHPRVQWRGLKRPVSLYPLSYPFEWRELMEAVKAEPSDASSRVTGRSSPAAADTTLEFGRFRVLLRQRQLLADGAPVELGTRAFDLLLVLLEADGLLVTKDEIARRVWPATVVSEANLKVQVCALRRALGEDRDFIRTDFGRGYRFIAAIRSATTRGAHQRSTRRSVGSNKRVVSQWISPDPQWNFRPRRHDRYAAKSGSQTL